MRKALITTLGPVFLFFINNVYGTQELTIDKPTITKENSTHFNVKQPIGNGQTSVKITLFHENCVDEINPNEIIQVIDPNEPPETTGVPSMVPSLEPADEASDVPSMVPSLEPSEETLGAANTVQSLEPTTKASDLPSMVPSLEPSGETSSMPSVISSLEPTTVDSDVPSMVTSLAPSNDISDVPSSKPSLKPTTIASDVPSMIPSVQPSIPSSEFTICPRINEVLLRLYLKTDNSALRFPLPANYALSLSKLLQIPDRP